MKCEDFVYRIMKNEYIFQYHCFPGLGTAFFPAQNVSFFPVLLKNVLFFPVLFWRLMRPKRTERSIRRFKRTGKDVKNVPFFCKEREKTQRSSRSFIKNGKERENVSFFFKRT